MRILFVTQNVPYPPHGGFFQRGFNLLRELGRQHEMHLLAFRHQNELPLGETLERSKRELGAFCSSIEYFDLWVKKTRAHKAVALSLATLHSSPFSVLAHRNAVLSRRIGELCRSEGAPDIVHLDTIALAPYVRHCGGIPIVLTHHNVESQLMQRRADHERGWLRQTYVAQQAAKLRRYEARLVGQFDANVMVSRADADTLLAYCPSAEVAVIPNGVDTGYFSPRWGRETPTLIFAGRMSMFANRDGVDWFLAAVWPAIKARVPEARFVAIGKSASARLLEAAARDDSVEAPGYVADVRPWVERAAVYVVPLRVGGGTRLKVLDAMAQGKAIVSTSLGAEGIDAIDMEHLVVADDAAAFADRVVKLLREPDTRRRLGEAARTRAVERYSWPALGEDLSELYYRVIANRQAMDRVCY